MSAAETKSTESVSVKPSSRDPIVQWLDVFTSLLSLPPAEAERIRDELEDHLRTRVDDLLILGMTEPEAVQKAVTELGETAQLARNFKSVRTHSRRRIAMHTALFAAAGLALTVSVAGLLPGKALTPIHAPTAAIEAQPEGVAHNAVLDQDLEAGTLGEMLQKLADAGNARLFVHWSSLEPLGLDADTEVRAIPAKGLDHAKVRQLINSALGLEGMYLLTARMDGNLIEIGSQEYFDRIETVTMDHDVSRLVPSTQVLQITDEGQNLIRSIETIIEPEIWNSRNSMASITINGSTVGVRAPERIQKKVIDYIARLEAAQRKNDDEARNIARIEAEQNKARDEQIINKYMNQIDRYQEELDHLQNNLDDMNMEYWMCDYRLKDLHQEYLKETDSQAKSSMREELARSSANLDSLNARLGLLREEIEAKRTAIAMTTNNISVRQAMVKGYESSTR